MTTLSERQMRVLNWVAEHEVTREHLDRVHNVTLWSLLHRRLIERHGGEGVVLTKAGDTMVMNYRANQPLYTKTEHELSERVERLFRFSRLVEMHKKGAA